MARRKRGHPISGWALVDKPAGIGSTAVGNKLRYHFQATKAGHGGTLDPDATGLLPIAFGEASKFLPFLEEELKTYEFTVNWGSNTTSDDASGEIIQRSDQRPSPDAILAEIPNFLGRIEQIPPAISAVKVNGERAYKLAREGEKPQLEPRELWVEELTLLSSNPDQAQFRMRCGKGGYVRSIARDMGQRLGCLGHVNELRRTATMGFDISDAMPLSQWLTCSASSLLPVDQTPIIEHLPVTLAEANLLGNGGSIHGSLNGIALAIHDDHPIAIVEGQPDGIHVRRGLNVVE